MVVVNLLIGAMRACMGNAEDRNHVQQWGIAYYWVHESIKAQADKDEVLQLSSLDGTRTCV